MNTYYCIVDSGNIRQVVVEHQSSLDFDEWVNSACDRLTGVEGPALDMNAGEDIRSLVLPTGVVFTFMSQDSLDRQKRRAQMAQAGLVGMG